MGTAIGAFAPASWEILEPHLATRFSPCGMVMEHLRACYTFTMRLYIGGQQMTFPARWYWALPNALPWQGQHGAEASVWLQNADVNPGWGEVTPYPQDPNAASIRGLDRGVNPGYAGQCFVGDPQWFVDGQLPASVLNDPPDPMPSCCAPPAVFGQGGVVLGGSAMAIDGCCQYFAPPGHTASVAMPAPYTGGAMGRPKTGDFWVRLVFNLGAFSLFVFWSPSGSACGAGSAGQAWLNRGSGPGIGALTYAGACQWLYPATQGPQGTIPGGTLTITNV